jgi:hypothetical protein
MAKSVKFKYPYVHIIVVRVVGVAEDKTVYVAKCSEFVVLFPEDWRDEGVEEVLPREVLEVLEHYWLDSTEETKYLIMYCEDSNTVYIIATYNWEGYQELVVIPVEANVEKIRERLHI